MKIIKKNNSSPSSTLPIFTIPLLTYTLEKYAGFINPEYEYIWFISLPISFLIWFFVNFKIKL